jgi:serine/threonine-protein kinase
MGVLLYEVLGGHAAFGGESLGEIFGNILHTDPTPLLSHRPDLPEGLAAAVMRCILRAPEERFQSVAELAAVLEPFGSGAYSEYVSRIARTLARSTRVTDSDRSSRPPSVPSVASTVPPPMIYTPVPPPPDEARATYVRPRDTSETLLDAGGTQCVLMHPQRRRRNVATAAVVAFVALACTVAIVRMNARGIAPPAAAAPAKQASDQSAAAVPAARPANIAPAPQASVSTTAPVASPLAQPIKRAPSSRHVTPTLPSKPRPGQLPSVLDSPE